MWSRCVRRVCNGKRPKVGRPGVARVFLEGEAEQSKLFASDRVEETVYDPAGETLPLVLVHVNHLRDTSKNTETFKKSTKLKIDMSPYVK